MPNDVYDKVFFDAIQDGARSSADAVVPLVLSLVEVRSVVDVGCGRGTWLSSFVDAGVARVLGVDGHHVDTGRLDVPGPAFLAWDLTDPLTLPDGYDLAMSLEVAEHLPPERGPSFVADLVRLAPVVLFSAAAPHQGGTHHVNERWPDYWARLFAEHGYMVVDCLRHRLWADDRVEWWYAQNMLLFVRADHADVLAAPAYADDRAVDGLPLRLVHPRLHQQWVDYALAEAVARWD